MERGRDVVGRALGIELVEEPEALLGEGERLLSRTAPAHQRRSRRHRLPLAILLGRNLVTERGGELAGGIAQRSRRALRAPALGDLGFDPPGLEALQRA